MHAATLSTAVKAALPQLVAIPAKIGDPGNVVALTKNWILALVTIGVAVIAVKVLTGKHSAAIKGLLGIAVVAVSLWAVGHLAILGTFAAGLIGA